MDNEKRGQGVANESELTIMVIVMQVRYQGITGVFYGIFNGGDFAEEYIFSTIMTLVAMVQCVNLSVALYILSVLDKHLMPMY